MPASNAKMVDVMFDRGKHPKCTRDLTSPLYFHHKSSNSNQLYVVQVSSKNIECHWQSSSYWYLLDSFARNVAPIIQCEP